MKEYYFFLNDYGELVCQKKINSSIIEYTNEIALEILSLLDNNSYKHVTASSKTIKLSNDQIRLIIMDYKKLMNYGYLNYLEKSLNRINRAINKHQAKKNNNKAIKNLKVQGSRIAVGSLLIAILSNTYQTVKNNDNNIEEPINTDVYENEYSSVDIPDTVTDNVITSQDIDIMLNELESTNNIENNYEENDLIETNEENETFTNVTYLNFESEVDGEKYEHAYNGYYDIVSKYSEKWGVPENVIMAMLTQESGGYVPDNLMQIVFESWNDQVLTEYDFVNNRYQSIVLTDEPEKYVGQDITIITREDLRNKVTNISVACAIFRYCLEQMHYNIPAAIQSYNQGCNGVKSVFARTSEETGIPVDELFNDQTNVEFMNYTNILDWGDPNYLNNVSRYIDNSNDITLKTIDNEGNINNITIAIAEKTL